MNATGQEASNQPTSPLCLVCGYGHKKPYAQTSGFSICSKRCNARWEEKNPEEKRAQLIRYITGGLHESYCNQRGDYYNLFESGEGVGVAHVKSDNRNTGNKIKRR